MEIIQTLITVCLTLIGVLIIEYFKEKGKNLATKEDIAEITHKIEEVKLSLTPSFISAEAHTKLKIKAFEEIKEAIKNLVLIYEDEFREVAGIQSPQTPKDEAIEKISNLMIEYHSLMDKEIYAAVDALTSAAHHQNLGIDEGVTASTEVVRKAILVSAALTDNIYGKVF